MADPTDKTLVQTQLRAIAQLLREVPRLDPETQTALADLIDELARSLESPVVPSAEIARLTDCLAQLARAVNEQHAPGILAAARDRLDHAVVAIETEAPGLASLTRRLAEMLSDVGL